MSDRVPEGWVATKLGTLGSFSKGKGISKSETISKGIPCLRYAEIYTNYDFVIKNFKSFIEPDTIKTTKKLFKNDIIFAGSGETVEDIGKSVAFISDHEAYVGGDSIILTPSPDLDSIFLSYQLNDEIRRKQLRKLGQGSSVIHIYSSGLEDMNLVLPPLPEQKKIASILTSVDEVIETTQKQIDKLQDLKKATMNELLTKGIGHTEFKDSELGRIPKSWEVKRLGDLLELKNGVNTDKDAFGSGFPFITYKDVHSGNDLNEASLTKFVKLSSKEHTAFSVNFGDIFFTRTSETPEEIGLSNTYLGKNIGAVFNGFCIRGRPKTKLLSANISKYLFRSDYVRTQMKFLCKYTTRAGISGESLNRCLIALPTMNDQHLFENTLINIDKHIRVNVGKLSQTQSLKKSLMQDLLTGKVRVQVN